MLTVRKDLELVLEIVGIKVVDTHEGIFGS